MSLRNTILRGGMFLSIRQAAGMAIGVVGVLWLTRIIGPSNYGRYAAAVGLILYLQSFASLGINVFLLRREKTAEDDALAHQAFTLLLLLSGVSSVVASLSMASIEAITRLQGISTETRWMLVLFPLVTVAQVPLASLERALAYRTIAAIELTGQITYYLVCLPLASLGHLSSAPFAGWITQQGLMAVAYFASSRYRPQLVWHVAHVRSIVSYGVSYSTSIWVWQLRTLVNPLVVGRFAGLESVGVVALAIRLTEYLTFVKAAAWRLSLAALGRMQGDITRMRKAVQDGMFLQILAVGPVLMIFGAIGPMLIPRLFGPDWAPAIAVFPLIAAGYLVNAAFNLHSSALYVLKLNNDVTVFHAVHIALFALSAVPLVSRLGPLGYGIAELVGLISYLVIARAVHLRIGHVPSAHAIAWAGAFAFSLFYSYVGIVALAGLMLLLLSRETRAPMMGIVKQSWEALSAR